MSALSEVVVLSTLSALTEMVSLVVAFEPIWKSKLVVWVRMRLPLNRVVLAVRVISVCSWLNSLCRAVRSVELLVALADCTASSRMRCSMPLMLPSAPSPVWASETASLALRRAISMPRAWAFMRSEIARPAASSFELFTRMPVDRRLIEVARLVPLVARLRCALSDSTLVLMIWVMTFLWKV